MSTTPNTRKGFSLIEVLVGVSIIVLVFTALFASFQAMLEFGERNRLRSQALLLANEHIEMIRALPYDSIGTVSGLPSGSLPQLENIVHDGRTYTRRTFIQYVDDPADGLGGADTLAADYKRIKVELSYEYHGSVQAFSMVTTVAPKSQESLVGAGILRIVVNDANNNPLSLASVHVVNTSVATSVDITTFTGVSGTVSFPGAWAGSGYEVTVSKAGYSTAQTYTSSVANPNPNPSPLTVAENSTTEIYFKIDQLSTVDIFARAWPVRGRLFDTFDDTTLLATTSGTQVSGGVLELEGSPGAYASAGTAISQELAPADLDAWVMLYASTTNTIDTSTTFTIEYDSGGGTFLPIPDGDLPGNSGGFASTPVDLGALDPTTYHTLRVVGTLTTTDAGVTPQVHEWTLSYTEESVPRSGVPINVRGAKIIGADSGGNSIFKYDSTDVTDAGGSRYLSDMEFDEYTVTPVGFTIAEACPSLPLVLEPDTAYAQTLTLEPASAHAYQVTVVHPLGGVVSGAEVRMQGGATDVTRVAGPCGVAHFPNLSEATYSVTVRAPGLAETTVSKSVSGLTVDSITLSL